MELEEGKSCRCSGFGMAAVSAALGLLAGGPNSVLGRLLTAAASRLPEQGAAPARLPSTNMGSDCHASRRRFARGRKPFSSETPTNSLREDRADLRGVARVD